MPRVDVFIPCYRYGHFLKACVESVLTQSHTHLRVLIIDDASPDNTGAVAAELAARDARVTVLTHTVNRGHIASYNEGLDWADGDYVLLLSADDLLAPGALRRAVAVMEAHPEVSLTYGSCVELFSDNSWRVVSAANSGRQPYNLAPTFGEIIQSPDGRPALADNPSIDPPWQIIPGIEFIKNACRIAGNVIPTPTAIGRNSIQKRIGGYRPELPHAGDTEMWLRYAVNGAVARTTANQAIKREHGRNMSVPYFSNLLQDYEQRRMVFEFLFRKYGDAIAGAPRLSAQANRGLAEMAFWHSIGKLVEGHPRIARDLYRFALSLNPEIRFRPPLGRLLRISNLSRKVGKVLRRLVLNLRHNGAPPPATPSH